MRIHLFNSTSSLSQQVDVRLFLFAPTYAYTVFTRYLQGQRKWEFSWFLKGNALCQRAPECILFCTIAVKNRRLYQTALIANIQISLKIKECLTIGTRMCLMPLESQTENGKSLGLLTNGVRNFLFTTLILHVYCPEAFLRNLNTFPHKHNVF